MRLVIITFIWMFVCIHSGLVCASECQICSWNVLRVGQAGHDQDKNWTIFTRAVADTRADVFAFQEVMNAGGGELLIAALRAVDANWQYVISERSGSTSYKECGMFAWRRHRVTYLVDTPAMLYSDHGAQFAKQPYAAAFRAGHFDFVLISAHVSFGEPKREAEVRALPQVVGWARTRWAGEQDVLLLGDWNAPPHWAYWTPLRQLGFVPVNTTTLTTFGKKKPRSMLYDNLWYLPSATAEYTGTWSVPQLDDLYYGGDFKAARVQLSDHLPICATFRTDHDDD